MPIKRMRTAPGVMEAILAEDPDTELTLHYIRTLIRTEAVPVLKVGKKKLVDVADVLAYLESSPALPSEPHASGEISRVPVR